MTFSWKLVAIVLAVALLALAIFTGLLINGILDFGLSIV